MDADTTDVLNALAGASLAPTMAQAGEALHGAPPSSAPLASTAAPWARGPTAPASSSTAVSSQQPGAAAGMLTAAPWARQPAAPPGSMPPPPPQAPPSVLPGTAAHTGDALSPTVAPWAQAGGAAGQSAYTSSGRPVEAVIAAQPRMPAPAQGEAPGRVLRL